MNDSFQPVRLAIARKRRGLTKLELAARCEITSRLLSNYEYGKTTPKPETAAALADALDFPVEFLYRDDPAMVTPETVSFRSLKQLTSRQRDSAIAAAALAADLDRWISARFDRPAVDVPDLQGHTPEAAAAAVRAEWGLGVRPIRELLPVFESRGIRVYALSPDASSGHDPKNADALSMWLSGVPFVFLSPAGTGERRRMSAAHELGHLVLHRHGAPHGQDAEREANAFAGAFLVPRADLLANTPRRKSLPEIIRAKKRWNVAAIALVFRMHEVGLLSDWEYSQLCIAIRGRFRSDEPEGSRKEVSSLLTQVFAALREERTGRVQIARELFVSVPDLDSICEGLTLTVVTGSGSPIRPGGKSPKPDVQLVGD